MNTPELTPEERAHVIELLHTSERDFLELVSGLTDAQWTQAATGRWSVAHTAEPLVLGETAMLSMIERALAAPPSSDWAEQDARKTAFIGRVLPDRSRKATAPALLEPQSRLDPRGDRSPLQKGPRPDAAIHRAGRPAGQRPLSRTSVSGFQYSERLSLVALHPTA